MTLNCVWYSLIWFSVLLNGCQSQKRVEANIKINDGGLLVQTVPMDVAASICRTFDLCYMRAVTLYEQRHFANATLLFEAALALYHTDKRFVNASEVDLLDIISYCAYECGDLNKAALVAEYAVKHPNITTEQRSIIEPKFQHYLAHASQHQRDLYATAGGSTLDIQRRMRANKAMHTVPEYAECGSGTSPLPLVSPNGFCRLNNRGSPLMVLQPAKEEIIIEKPSLLLVYHDFLSEQEVNRMNFFSRFAKSSPGATMAGDMTSASAFEGTPFYDDKRSIRETDVSWIGADLAHFVERRIAHYTGLNMKGSENFQYGKYDIGGHYVPHLDAFQSGDLNLYPGNRIATLMIYLDEPSLGGETLFPTLGVQVKPERGKALLWFNIYPYGPGDAAMKHAACPILNGTKTIVTKWMRVHPQIMPEFNCKRRRKEKFGLADLSRSSFAEMREFVSRIRSAGRSFYEVDKDPDISLMTRREKCRVSIMKSVIRRLAKATDGRKGDTEDVGELFEDIVKVEQRICNG